MLKKSHQYFTLVEIMIVMTILALVTGVIGINVRHAFQVQRFKTEVDLVVNTLRLAQDMMLILGVDVHFHIDMANDRQGFVYWLEVDDKLPPDWIPIVKKASNVLKETHRIELIPPSTDRSGIDIQFLSDGSVMTRGLLRMSTHQDFRSSAATTRVIPLLGYPHPIESIPETAGEMNLENPDLEEYYRRLSQITIQEVLEDTPPKAESNPEKSQDSNQSAPESNVNVPKENSQDE